MIDFIESQLAVWPEANARYAALGTTQRRVLSLGDMQIALQYNPARAVSTAAVTDKAAIAARPCFLCDENRPPQQSAIPLDNKWQMLLNPFPIFPVHFTIASLRHEPQRQFTGECIEFADRYPELAIFFNGAGAGASAPDHAHMQAVLSSELPLLHLTEQLHPIDTGSIISTASTGADLPFHYYSALITPDNDGLTLMKQLFANRDGKILLPANPVNPDKSQMVDEALVNVIAWKDSAGHMRVIIIPRRAHRPQCWPEVMVSPGTIDMAGTVITPRREDFDSLQPDDIREIYRQVAYA